MQAIIGFICALIMAATVYAAPVTTDNHVLSEKDVVAITPEELALPAGATQQVGMQQLPQMEQMQTLPQGSLPATTQENHNAVGGLQAGSPTFPQEQPSIIGPQAQLAAPAQEMANVAQQSLGGGPNERLATLESQNIKMQAQITQLNERIGLVEERLIGNVGVQKTQECFGGKASQYIGRLQDRIGHKLFAIIVSSAVIVFLLFLIYIIFPRRNDYSSVSHHHENSPPKGDDFNPMEGQEGAVAKLNLARAYIEMGKEHKAEGVLYDVLAHGNEAEQEEAKTLLAKIENPSSTDH
jgi:FimV-like protein